MEKSKEPYHAEQLMTVTINAIRETEEQSEYAGKIEGLASTTLVFNLIFNVSLNGLDFLTEVGDAIGIPAKTIGSLLHRAVENRYALKIMDEKGAVLDFPAEELDALFFQPISMAVSLLKEKQEATQGTFRVPLLAEEEMGQFQTPQDLQEFVASLNR